MTVLLDGGRNRPAQEPGSRGEPGRWDLNSVRQVEPLQQGQALRAANRRRRRLQKRADKLAAKLSDTLNAAMDLSLGE
ncbi:guanine nucleotide-binding protein-like 3-like protein [Mobula birostris]